MPLGPLPFYSVGLPLMSPAEYGQRAGFLNWT